MKRRETKKRIYRVIIKLFLRMKFSFSPSVFRSVVAPTEAKVKSNEVSTSLIPSYLMLSLWKWERGGRYSWK